MYLSVTLKEHHDSTKEGISDWVEESTKTLYEVENGLPLKEDGNWDL